MPILISETPRTDEEIVEQTNDLARICLSHMGYDMPDGHAFYQTADTRSMVAWHRACEIMEYLTATDPNDALSAISDADAPQEVADASHERPGLQARRREEGRRQDQQDHRQGRRESAVTVLFIVTYNRDYEESAFAFASRPEAVAHIGETFECEAEPDTVEFWSEVSDTYQASSWKGLQLLALNTETLQIAPSKCDPS